MGGSWGERNKPSASREIPGPYEEIDEVPLTKLPARKAPDSSRARGQENTEFQGGMGITRTTQVSATVTHNSLDSTDEYIRQHPWASTSERV